jgi:hypothetical protein
MRHLSCHPKLKTCSSDTILRAIKELTLTTWTTDSGGSGCRSHSCLKIRSIFWWLHL